MDLVKSVHKNTEETIRKLDEIWDQIGLDVEVRKQREQTVYRHISELCNDMVEEAIDNRSVLQNSIELLKEDLMVLKKDLNEDISLEKFQSLTLVETRHRLQKQLEMYKHVYTARKNELNELFKREKDLCSALGKQIKSLPTKPLPSLETVSAFRCYIEELSDEKFRKEEQFLKIKSAIVEIMNELHIEPTLDFEKMVVSGNDADFKVNDYNMKELEKLHSSLFDQREDIKQKISVLRERVTTLWERLEECPEVRSSFLNANPGNSIDTLNALKYEIVRCEQKKMDNIKIFVDKTREDLLFWWNECRCSSEERSRFLHFESDCYTEDLLTLHEMEIEKLKAFYEENKTIFQLFVKREKLWEKMLDLERRANEPDRYKNRGGKLLCEEKERKSIASKLPTIENEILNLVQKYETQTNSPFKINGELVADIINRDWEEHKENKHIKLSARKQAREHATVTPSRFHLTASSSKPIPSASTTKRRLLTPVVSSKRTRLFVENKLKSAPPKILINGSVIKRASLERKKKVEKHKLRSHIRREKNNAIESISSDYDCFEKGLLTNSTCRSTLFQEKKDKNLKIFATPTKTPRKALQAVSSNTPQIQRTPSQINLRSKSPCGTPRLTAATPGNLPILF